MNRGESMRFASICGIALSLVLSVQHASAQSQPATIPTVVAQAMSFEPGIFGKPQFFDGRTPPEWPRALVPPGTTVIGGGVIGDSAMFRMQTAVFAFSARSNPGEVVRTMLAQAGYARHNATTGRSRGGFAETEPSASAAQYCKGSTLATFAVVDSVQAPLVIAVHLLDGEAGRENCTQSEQSTPGQFPVSVPPLSAPGGAMQFGGSSSWSGSGGNMESTLRTTMPVDSVLSHYSAQLAAGGWTIQGQPSVGSGAGLQRFALREGQERWAATLIVVAMGDAQREVLLHVHKPD